MTTLKRSPRRDHSDVSALDRKARNRLVTGLEGAIDPFFPFDGVVAVARPRSDGALIFEVMSPGFPLRSIAGPRRRGPAGRRPAEAYGELGRIWVGGSFGLKAYPRADSTRTGRPWWSGSSTVCGPTPGSPRSSGRAGAGRS